MALRLPEVCLHDSWFAAIADRGFEALSFTMDMEKHDKTQATHCGCTLGPALRVVLYRRAYLDMFNKAGIGLFSLIVAKQQQIKTRIACRIERLI